MTLRDLTDWFRPDADETVFMTCVMWIGVTLVFWGAVACIVLG